MVFVQRMDPDGSNVQNEGFCIICAKELGIKPVTDMLEKMGIDDEQMELMSQEMENILESGDFSALMNPDGFDMKDDDDYEDDEEDDSEEGRAPSINLGSIFGNLNNFRKNETDGVKADGDTKGDTKKKEKKKKVDKHRKNLEAFCQDLTAKAREGKIDKVIGREREIDRVTQILSRRQKNNPCLIGEPGVGKTAIAEALAMRIAAGEVPYKLRNHEVHLLDMTSMVAGTQFRGQFENRMKSLIEEIKRLGNIILVIDEIHTIAGAGDAEGGMNAANILKPALSRGEVQIIGATTLSEYRKYIEKDSALERRFQPVVVAEPSVKDSIEILKGIKGYYEEFHGIVIPDETVEKAVIFSERYITDRFLPDKAIDLLDEASSYLTLNDENVQNCDMYKAKYEEAKKIREMTEEDAPETDDEAEKEKYFEKVAAAKRNELVYDSLYLEAADYRKNVVLTPAHLASVVEIWTGIPASNINENEFVRIDGLEKRLKDRIIGQDKAISAVTRAIKRSRAGIYTKIKPVSFIFAGPTGVGKTELVKTLSNDLFDSPEALIRLDMSEFMEKHAVSRIIGAPPGYVGYDEAGQLTEKIRRRPYSVVLFDEIEKAHPDVLNVLLQILDDGKVTDAHGKEVNFCNTIIVMTTNAGSQNTSNTAGFSKTENEANEDKTNKALSSFLRPEFMNRIDEIITFNSLTKEDFIRIAKIMLGELSASLAEKGIALEYTDEIPSILADKSYSVKYGARNLRRTIQTEIEDKASELIISSYDSKMSGISIYAENGEIKIIVTKA
ncbi:MAG: ATP-dependent Clp protease ATP-binding subunit [Ruminococcaceae bacterium]|nr:ATP-dependent Clp protease ATP-binding subunit [Oscillospiraceae bacterium]